MNIKNKTCRKNGRKGENKMIGEKKRRDEIWENVKIERNWIEKEGKYPRKKRENVGWEKGIKMSEEIKAKKKIHRKTQKRQKKSRQNGGKDERKNRGKAD